MCPEREYCFTYDRSVPYDRDSSSDARRREADRGILRRLNAKEEQRLLREEHDQLRVPKSALETRYTVLEDMYERMRADRVSHSLLNVQSAKVTRLIQRETRRLVFAFVSVTFRDGAPQKTRGGYGLAKGGLPLLPRIMCCIRRVFCR